MDKTPGRAEPILAGEEELLAGGQVVGVHDVPVMV